MRNTGQAISKRTGEKKMKKRSKPAIGGEKILASLRQAVEGLQNNDTAKVTVRTYQVPEPSCYSPRQIKALRVGMHMSQAIFADVVGVSVKLIEHWESGVRTPSKMACRLMDVIQRDPTKFLPKLKKSA
jgi:putative transcriptional regulator